MPHGYALTWKANERESLWNLRKKGVGLLGNAPGARKPSSNSGIRRGLSANALGIMRVDFGDRDG